MFDICITNSVLIIVCLVVWRSSILLLTRSTDDKTCLFWICLCTEYIQPVCLPAHGQRLIDGQMGTVTGWGNVGYYGESSPTIWSFYVFKLLVRFYFKCWYHSQVVWQMFCRKSMCPSSVMLFVMLQTIMTIRSPPLCSVLALRKGAQTPVRSETLRF